MNIDPKMIKIFVLTIIFMLLLCIAAILTKARASDNFTGTYDTPFIRGMWTSCYNGAVSRRIHPAAAAVYCDCVTDLIRERHTKQETDNMSDKVQVFTSYAGECSMKLFGPKTLPPEELT